MIYTVTFSPTLDYIVGVEHFRTGSINRTTSETIYPGGKGINVSLTLKRLGFENTALGFTAGFTGAEIRRLLHGYGVECNFISVEQGMSRINMKILSDEETAINGQGAKVTPENIGTLYARLRCLVDGDFLVLAGHIPDSLPSNMYEQVLMMLENRRLNVIVDAEKEALTDTLKYKPFLIKPNRDELGDIFGVKLQGREEVVPYARKLMEIQAIKLQPNEPFTWASGWKSPIYTDNRKTLSFPQLRSFVKLELCHAIQEHFPEAEAVAGVATGAIAQGALVADQLGLPYSYVRPKPKDHGMGNQVEGEIKKGAKVVVVEDLISTGGSSLKAVAALRAYGVEVIGMVASLPRQAISRRKTRQYSLSGARVPKPGNNRYFIITLFHYYGNIRK